MPARRTGSPDPGRSRETRKSFLLRIDAAVWKEIEAWAAAELRSVNGQIEYLLREAAQQRRRGGR